LTDLYSHVLVDHRDEWRTFWREAYATERAGGVRRVFNEDPKSDGNPLHG
jgi:hypothetical protein